MGVLYLGKQLRGLGLRKSQKLKGLFGGVVGRRWWGSAKLLISYYILFDFEGATLYVALHAVTHFSKEKLRKSNVN